MFVCKDSWLPDNIDFKLLGSVRGIDRESKVSDHIDGDLDLWKRELISASFDLEEAKQIQKNILPSKDNLLKKGIRLDVSCSLCHYVVESAYHLFLQCEFAKQVSFSSILSYRVSSDMEINEWLLSLLTYGDMLSVQLLCSLLQKIWNARNLQLYQQKSLNPIRVAEVALECVLEFNKWNPEVGAKKKLLVHSELEIVPKNIHVLQVDSGVFMEGFVSYGCTIKNHRKLFLLLVGKGLSQLCGG
ncbi:unnamed protein product [Vicia faba]|uniref:Reverse transcriptase zinc-binding domain-containing protein n=1 Tax=Vicia faba TaxID=3906 RepID=A0AAV0YFN4_VICFA|nr:unnamed protein product [Vicia faba]